VQTLLGGTEKHPTSPNTPKTSKTVTWLAPNHAGERGGATLNRNTPQPQGDRLQKSPQARHLAALTLRGEVHKTRRNGGTTFNPPGSKPSELLCKTKG